tara:strand:+ start:1705 stop:2283 length:579 start_codon:yes stop_codon:yes gene_type:complete
MKNLCIVFCIALIFYNIKAYGAEAGMPQLDPKFWVAQIFWLVLIFLGLYLIVSKVFLPKITLTIESRKSKIVNDLNEAQKLKENAEIKLKEYNKIIENSKKEALKIISEGRKKLSEDIEIKKKKFDAELEKELRAVESEINELKNSSKKDVIKIAESTSVEIIKQIIGAEVNKSSVSAMVNEVLNKKENKSI